MIVLEKTRDIGTLRAIGASASGIAMVFLGYGLAVGVIGAGLGTLLAVGVVTNLNGIQEVLDAVFGWRMWNPQTYYFDRIPDRVAWADVAGVAAGAVVSSVAGALIPALLAARQDPVETLRYE
jgi:lipoprotein-releasing system permease protein